MRIRIKYRLFLAMLAATGTVVVCMFLVMQWSMSRGFLRYVNMMEQERLESLSTALSQEYAFTGSWDALRGNDVRWGRIVSESVPPGHFRRRLRGMTGFPPPPPPQQQFESRAFLLDDGHRRIAGPEPQQGSELRPVLSDGRTVGYLGLLPRDRLTDALQLRFVKQQKMAMAISAVIVFLVSAGVALPLANRLLRPIGRLAEALHRLASGRFETRVPDEGEDELGQLARDVNTLALSLERNERTRRQWVADISHELRTPLAVLRGEIEAMQDGVRATDAEGLRSLHAEAVHLGRLVDDLYQLSLSDVGALSYRKEEIDLAAVLAQAVETFRPRFAQRTIALRLKVAGSVPVFGDRERLHQLFTNLMENSLKYTDPGGELEVRLEQRHGEAAVDFRDSAPGVPVAELERLFDRLYRVESSRNRASGGAGLGLSICRNVAEAHGGSISARPSPAGGLWIRVALPVSGRRG